MKAWKKGAVVGALWERFAIQNPSLGIIAGYSFIFAPVLQYMLFFILTMAIEAVIVVVLVESIKKTSEV